MKTGTQPIPSALAIFRQYKGLADKAMAQLKPEELFICLEPESNSIAVIMKHLSGNMRSRWTDIFTSDGEKPSRQRDQEFEIFPTDTTEKLMEEWEKGWNTLFQTLESLTENDIGKIVTIRSEAHSVLEAMNRQIAHYSYHVGQIVFIAKAIRSHEWKTLSIARGHSDAYNQTLMKK